MASVSGVVHALWCPTTTLTDTGAAQTYTAPPAPPSGTGTVVAPQTENGGGGGVNPNDRWKIIVGVVVGVVAALLFVFLAWCCVRTLLPATLQDT